MEMEPGGDNSAGIIAARGARANPEDVEPPSGRTIIRPYAVWLEKWTYVKHSGMWES